ncbi:MAG: L-threonylcarbamoyladenylate synthase [Cognatishimia sp.]|uniref:L-threonylcarbamoyladenylate synthase n=1 Tax=Cognatishimia sp. TaxID=2211648 RepID=UPI0040580236
MSDLTKMLINPDLSGCERAASIWRDSGLVAMPTETVYGLGADARNDRAVARIYEAKGRPSFNPLIVHLADAAMARDLVHWNDHAEQLANAFWPGPLTLVLPLKPDAGISPLVTAGKDTLAIRVPQHPVAHALLSAFGGPVAAPSANPSGKISPTLPEHVLDGLSERIQAVVDGGACGVGLESTIVGLFDGPCLLRPGGVPAEAIEATLDVSLTKETITETGEAVSAPGQLLSHYAPKGTMRLNVIEAEPHEVHLGFGDIEGTMNLSPAGDMAEAAANLFRFMHDLDAQGAQAIAVAPIPMTGLGVAINDRLARAAAPRD